MHMVSSLCIMLWSQIAHRRRTWGPGLVLSPFRPSCFNVMPRVMVRKFPRFLLLCAHGIDHLCASCHGLRSLIGEEHGAQGWYFRHCGSQTNGSYLFKTIERGKTDAFSEISVVRRSRTRSRGWSKWVPTRKVGLCGRYEGRVPGPKCGPRGRVTGT